MPPIPETGWRPPKYYPNLDAADVLSIDCEAKDTELSDFGPFWARGRGHICGFSIGTKDGYRWYFPVRHEVEPEMNLNPEHTFAWLRDVAKKQRCWVGANLIYDVGAFRSEGIYLQGDLIDVQFAEALLDERAEIALDVIAHKYLGVGKTTSVLKQWCQDYYATSDDTWRQDIYRSPPRLAGPYGEGDADLPIRLAPVLYQRLQAEGLLSLFRMECELIPLLVEMRYAGVSVNLNKAEQLKEELKVRAADQHKKLESMLGFDVQVNSGDSVAKAFDAIGISYPRTKPSANYPNGKPSFVKAWLKKQTHPVAQAISEVRRLDKLRSTFVESYILESNVNGKIYCSFHPLRGEELGTRSGRFSSSNPNLQNIPIRDPELGKLIRSMFCPDPGHEDWKKFDYSQIEYRILVSYAVGQGSDEARAKYCREPRTDYHKMTKALIEAAIGQEMDRSRVKNVNFGLTYGMGVELLDSEYLHLGIKAAKQFLEHYHKGVPFAKPTLQAYMQLAARYGTISTVLGRKSRFDLWEPEGFDFDREDTPALPYEIAIRKYGRIKRAYTHKSLNRLLQGSAADLMKMAMLNLWKSGVFSYTGVPRLTVHDELCFSNPGAPKEAWQFVKNTLERAIKFRVPILTSAAQGKDWGSTSEEGWLVDELE